MLLKINSYLAFLEPYRGMLSRSWALSPQRMSSDRAIGFDFPGGHER